MIVKTDFSLLAVYFFQTQTYYTISSDLRHPQLLSRSSRLFALTSAVSVHVKAKHSLCSARVDNRGHLMGFLRVATKIRIVSCILNIMSCRWNRIIPKAKARTYFVHFHSNSNRMIKKSQDIDTIQNNLQCN